MRIAVNCRLLLKDRMEGIAVFTWEVCRRMAESHPEDEFIFFFDRKPSPKFHSLENITPVVLSPQARHPILWKMWFEKSLSKALIKYDIDVLFSPEFYLSKTSDIPTVIVVHDLGFLKYPETYKSAHLDYFKKEVPLFLNKADHIIAVTLFTKNEIKSAYNIDEQKISIVGNAPRHIFKKLNAPSQFEVRNTITNGHPYILYLGSIHPRKNLIQLIQAFNLFKKENNNQHKLVMYGRWAFKNKSLKKVIAESLFKSDIIFCGDKDIAVEKAVASATCLVYPSLYEGFGIPIIEAMACGIPVITSDRGAMKEVGGEAAVFINPENPEDIKDALQKLCSEDDVNSEKLVNHAQHYSWDDSATKVYAILEKIATKQLNN